MSCPTTLRPTRRAGASSRRSSTPVAGNHEYGDSSDCTPSDASGYYSYFGAAAGVAGQGYYSYDIGTWHLIALNSNCKFVPGGCDVGSPQELWLKNDLAAHPAKCVLAYWHHPMVVASAGPDVGDDSMTGALWTDLVTAHAELVLVGHDHTYQRYTALDASRDSDSRRPRPGHRRHRRSGARGHADPAPVAPRERQHHVWRPQLTLRPDSYVGQFLPAAGTGSFTDSFSGSCA